MQPRTGMVFIALPPGEFEMGSKDGRDDEKPIHRVRLTRAFRMGKYPVTNAEYARFLEANPTAKPPLCWQDSR